MSQLIAFVFGRNKSCLNFVDLNVIIACRNKRDFVHSVSRALGELFPS